MEENEGNMYPIQELFDHGLPFALFHSDIFCFRLSLDFLRFLTHTRIGMYCSSHYSTYTFFGGTLNSLWASFFSYMLGLFYFRGELHGRGHSDGVLDWG